MGIIGNLRGTLLTTAAKVLIISLLAVTLYNLASFSRSSQDAVNQSFSTSAKSNLFALTDQLVDPGAFHEFRSSTAKIRTAAKFYDELESNKRLKLLSIFDQNLPVANFKGNDAFEYGYGTDMRTQGPHPDESLQGSAVNVKSMQMNEEAFDFYKLAADSGAGIDWEAVNYADKTIPVLLGANYKGVYQLGDTFKGNYYSHVTDFTVAGFLRPDSSIFYQDNFNFFLDDYVVIPYPKSIANFPERDSTFYGILAFAMINANLATSTHMPAEGLLAALREAGAASGFEDYLLMNVPSYIIQFALVRSLIIDNLSLLMVIELVLGLGALVLVIALTRFNHRRRRQQIRTLWTLGRSRSSLGLTAIATTALEYALVGLVLVLVIPVLPNQDSGSIQTIVLALVVAFFVDALWQRRLFRRTITSTARTNA